jgi:uncharacterized protein involved in response to NO
MVTTAEKMRAWEGPALLTYGFRPFFLGAGLWALLSMGAWLAILGGGLDLPTAFDLVSWHAHAFLFGYLGAVLAGFLLTAVPNWTGRLPIVGWPLGGLVALWLAGRIAVTVSALIPSITVALTDLAFPLVLAAVLAREIIAGKNWRNLMTLAILLVFALGNGLFHWEAMQGGYPANGIGLRIALGAAIMMIGVIGGRVVPSFTRNWLVRRGVTRLPVPPMQHFDKLSLLVLALALLLWVGWPASPWTGLALVVAGLAHAARLSRWQGAQTATEPLVWVLHAGYGFLPAGALAMGGCIIWTAPFAMPVAQHLWMAGAIGIMTLAIMTRATLGHTGRPLAATRPTLLIYLSIILSVLARLAAGLASAHAGPLHLVAGIGWLGAFGIFTLAYGRLHLTHRKGS